MPKQTDNKTERFDMRLSKAEKAEIKKLSETLKVKESGVIRIALKKLLELLKGKS